MASKYSSLTPYNYAFNDPVIFNDPSGADPIDDMHERMGIPRRGYSDLMSGGNYHLEMDGGGGGPTVPGYGNHWSDQFTSSSYMSVGSMINQSWNATPTNGFSVSHYNNGLLTSQMVTNNYMVVGDGNGNGYVFGNFGNGIFGGIGVGNGSGDRIAFGPGSTNYNDGNINYLSGATTCSEPNCKHGVSTQGYAIGATRSHNIGLGWVDFTGGGNNSQNTFASPTYNTYYEIGAGASVGSPVAYTHQFTRTWLFGGGKIK